MKTKSFIKSTLLFTFFAALTSCSKDDPKEVSGNELVEQMTAEEKLLVGEWIADGGNPLFLYSDNSCYTPDKKHGTYSFDQETKELITTSGWGIRIVKSLDEKKMVLKGVQSSKVWTYERQMNFIDNNYQNLIIGTWRCIENPQNKVKFISSDKFDFGKGEFYYKIITGGKHSDGTKYILATIDDDKYTNNIYDDYYLYITHLDCNTMIVNGSGDSIDGTYERIK